MSEQPLSVPQLCKAVGISKSAYYRCEDDGYEKLWPRIKKTSKAHFLKWCEQNRPQRQPDPVKEFQATLT